ncbi:MAG: DUF4292 domain-containing protein [Bacteroidia bacterium]|nr:DUF4292 domain-containing protein [Bacteroidia bacterium]
MKRLIFLSLLSVLVFSSGCKLFKKGQKEDPNVRLLREVVSQTTQSNLDFENAFISGRAKLEMPEGDFKNLAVDYRIYMDKGDAILVRVKKFIEVAKVYIDKDSIYVVNKINKELYVLPTSQSESLLGFKADFSILEDVLMGNLNLFGLQLQDLNTVDMESNPISLSGKFQTSELNYKIDKEIYKLLSLAITDSVQKADASLNYGDFEEIEGVKIPKRMKIDVKAPQEAQAEFSHKRIELNKKDFKISFEVPKSYERVDY